MGECALGASWAGSAGSWPALAVKSRNSSPGSQNRLGAGSGPLVRTVDPPRSPRVDFSAGAPLRVSRVISEQVLLSNTGSIDNEEPEIDCC